MNETFRLSLDTIDPSNELYLRIRNQGDRSIHAWRDPFLFRESGKYYMLVQAKRKGGQKDRNACIALLESDERLTTWSVAHPSLVTGHEELDVPQLFRNRATREINIFASEWDGSDYEMRKTDPDSRGTKPKLLHFTAKDFSCLLKGSIREEKPALTPDDNIYAGIIVPELRGSIVGFDTKKDGEPGIRKEHFRNLEHLDKDCKRV